MASSMTTLTLVCTVKKVESLVTQGVSVADATHGFTRVTVSVAADGTNKAGFGEFPGGATLGGGTQLLTFLMSNVQGSTKPAAGDTFNLVLN